MNHKPDPDRLTKVIAESAQQIWLAGLDAMSMAEKEGSRFFDTLSKLSENLQSHTLKSADVAKQTVSGGKNTATETWDRLEEMFELRVGRALNALQIPTARDIKELTKRVDKLSRAVDELGARNSADKKSTTAKKKRKKEKKKPGKKGKEKKSAAKPRKKRSRA